MNFAHSMLRRKLKIRPRVQFIVSVVEKVETVKTYPILVEKIESCLSGVEQNFFFKMSAEKVEKAETCQFLFEKVDTNLCGVE